MIMRSDEINMKLRPVISKISGAIICICIAQFILVPGALAQNDPVEKAITGAFNEYRSRFIQEKLFIHTDKNSYLSREICWFRIYYVDGFYNRPASLSTIAYVEMLDKNNLPVLQEKISLKPGESNGSFIVPVNISSGTYKLRAYTNWMKNFSADYFFEKAIRIVNSKELQTEPVVSKTKHYDLQFFPEGGNMVQDIETRVGFRITDAYGRGLDGEGMLLNSNGDTVLKFHPEDHGLGSFLFTPAMGKTYEAVVRFPQGEQVRKQLPSSYERGYVMNFSGTDDSEIVARVKVSPDLDGQDVYLFVHGSHEPLPVKKQPLINGRADFPIKTGELEDGISRITLFDKTGRPLCERLYFKYPEEKILISTEGVSEYTTRKKVALTVSVKDQSGIPVSADMSMAVYRIDSLQPIDENDIRNYLYLTADLGPVESPAFYFRRKDPARARDMDNLMLTHGWRRFIWKDLSGKNPAPPLFPPELNGHIIQGKLTDNTAGTAVAGTSVYLSIPSTRTQFRVTTTDANGHFKFEMPGFYGSQEIILQTNPAEDSVSHIDIASPFSDKYSANSLPEFSIPPKNSPELLDQSVDEQVRHVYLGTKLNRFAGAVVDTNSFYVEPDEKYLLDDYTRFQTMEEVLREYVRSVSVSRKKDKFQLFVENKPQREFFPEGPLILIDGVPFFDSDELFKQDPMKIRRLDLLNREYSLGYQSFKGIVNVTTYHGDLGGIQLNTHPTVLDYPGIGDQREFFSPVYETEDQVNSRIPDFRTLLYWSPEIQTDDRGKKALSFYTSDLPGKYAIVMMGITKKGEPASRIVVIDIKK
jgi:hypothetical protein